MCLFFHINQKSVHIKIFQEYLQAIQAAEERLSELQEFNNQLQDQTSPGRQTALQAEQTDIEHRLRQVHEALEAKVTALNAADEKWSLFYGALDEFGGWLDLKESELNKIHRGSLNPDEQFEQATVSTLYNVYVIIY